ncbi:hypothetical protein B0J14DRAFT_642201 [Halenospora varia]|nr:hypothetical protein B0J14DRAFT_642201 [Halenospora varia]
MSTPTPTPTPPPGPWTSPTIPHHSIHPLPLATFHALEAGDLDLANSRSSSTLPALPPFLMSYANRAHWRRRLDQLTGREKEEVPWLSRVVVYSPPASVKGDEELNLDPDLGRDSNTQPSCSEIPKPIIIGRIGFHGPPFPTDTLEVGYEVSPEHRRQGHAKAAMRIMVHLAREMEGIKVLRACVAPENEGSRRVVEGVAMVKVGRERHERRGWGDVYELDVE